MVPKNEKRKTGGAALSSTLCITGPEATGKSTLSEQLASEFRCPMVPEFARIYLRNLSRAYRKDDLDEILRGQLQLEERAIFEAEDGPVVCDTGPEVIWVWSYFKYGHVSSFIERTTTERKYPGTLLLDIDLPWTADPLRENPSLQDRRQLLKIYQDLLGRIGRPYHMVSGIDSVRVDRALQSAQSLLRE